ncbi:hypothetical protein AU210_008480 [Fusarium oxysporum f. sp. radicis-cucumerinum]|uniref:Zn(2)-C6 fungal-type domain-containing protein n=1 Tax=Fusarium oxysporum f. sp. radicis-cucumerinum TaxID=327505 RepID=A0A2H3HA81_FUSOX|nr:hypothetical protein AU210_008480 [Fusarium oxysporum f. sp. radicis-cucumerinum]
MSEPPAKRRKVRKGTRSCWECRRRKIKCQFSKEDDPICIGCTQRETSCISQEYVPTPPSAPQDKRLAQRLGRLEELMEKLVEKPLPSPESEDPALERFTQHTADVFESSVVDNAQQILDQPDAAIVTHKFPSRSAKATHVSAQLHALFPSQQILYAISQQSPGARFVLAMFYSQQDQIDGKPEPLSSLAQIPPITSHPAILAKRLLQLAVCLQQMPPFFDGSTLGLSKSPRETMEEWIAVTGRLVTSDDDFVGCLEGLECLILQSFYQSDAGHLRKAWLTGRRALNMAQLMGIDRKSAKSIKSVDPSFSNKHRPSPPVIWFRINCNDRYVSLILGLPIGSRDNSFAEDNALVSDAPSDKLGKVYAMMAGKIADRNELKGSEAYVLTQSIDMELEKAYKMMDDGLWWKLPDMAICCASRDVLARFIEYRNCFTTSVSGRHVDYSALVAAMTLLLGYLGWRWPGYETEKEHDRDLAEKTQERMQEMGALNNDRLCIEAAETIRQLLPIVQRQSGTSGENVHLNVPFLGTVNINPGPTPPASTASMIASNSTTPSGNVDMSQFPLSFNSPNLGSENCDLSTTCAFTPDVLDSNWPCFTADPEDWALQGVDTTYWTMLNSSIA